jgi:hypothetical protein
MSISRTLRSALFLVSSLAISGAAIGVGCAQPAIPDPTGSTATGAGGATGEARCTGTPPSCVGLDDFDCQTTNGCGHVGKCQGTAIACGLLSTTGCAKQGGCSAMTVGNCFGTPQQCFNFSNQSSCQQQKGCSWDPNSFFCNGSPTTCQQLTNQNCLAQQGCMSNQMSDCQGTPTPCPTFNAEGDCNQEIGCNWLSECTGAPTACKALSDADCAYQPGCACDGCGAASSSSTGGGSSCTKQSDCDPAKDACKTGNCINGTCDRLPGCQQCVKQIECNPHVHPCFSGNCVDGTCQVVASCHACTTPADCGTSADKCNTGNCVDGTCEAQTACTSGDGCCPPGCAGQDSDCP